MGKQSREKWEKREFAANGNVIGAVESKTDLEKTCIFIIRWGIYLSLFVPIILLLQFFFPFVAPKTTIFRILIEVIFTAYLFLAISNRRYRPRIDALTISLTMFLAAFILTSFTGINLSRSFWSTYERMTGMFTMIHLYVFFIILKSVFKKREDWEKFLGASIIVGVFLSIYVLKGSEASTRGGGTIGNSSFLAAYLIFDVFFALIILLVKKGYWRIFSAISLLIMLPVFLRSTARGAIASFFLGLSLLFLGYLIFSGKKILRRAAIALIALSVLSAVSVLLIMPSPIEQKTQQTLLYMKSRFVVWESGLEGFLERPILGWGPENFNSVFQKNFNPCMSLVECGGEVWFDRVHNIIFDTLVTTGFIGLLSYLSIFMIIIYGLFKSIPKIVEKKNIFLPLGLVAILTAYFVQNLLVFDMINSYLMFFLTITFAGFLIEDRKDKEFPENKIGRPNFVFASLAIISIIFIIWAGNLKPLIANRYIIKMVASDNAQDFAAYFQKSLDSWMDKYETREQATQKLNRSSWQLTNLSQEDKEIFKKVYSLAEVEMEKSVKENYLDFRHHLFLSELYLSSYRIDRNSEKLEKSEKILKRAIELSPTNQQGYWLLSELMVTRGKPEEAIPILEKAISLDPRVGMGYWYLAIAYQITGEYELALKKAFEAREHGYDWVENENLNNLNRVLDIYKQLNKRGGFVSELKKYDEEQLQLIIDYIKFRPENADPWFALAAVYANLEQYSKAIQAAQKAMQLNPALKQKAEEFIKSLPVQVQ